MQSVVSWSVLESDFCDQFKRIKMSPFTSDSLKCCFVLNASLFDGSVPIRLHGSSQVQDMMVVCNIHDKSERLLDFPILTLFFSVLTLVVKTYAAQIPQWGQH